MLTSFPLHSPLILFIVQAAVIVGFSRILAFFLKKIRQPQVIAEVIAGILIGPSVFGTLFSLSIVGAPPPGRRALRDGLCPD